MRCALFVLDGVLFLDFVGLVNNLIRLLIMGNCCHSQNPILGDLMLELQFDPQHHMFNSYFTPRDRIFQKRMYNWHSIPLSTALPVPTDINPTRTYFQVRNVHIKNNNFLVGIVDRSVLEDGIPKPWTTTHCLCYQSHENDKQSNIILENQPIQRVIGTKRGQLVRVSIDFSSIQFGIDGVAMHRMPVPQGLRYEMLPYVVLFSQGDQIEFINQIGPQKRNV